MRKVLLKCIQNSSFELCSRDNSSDNESVIFEDDDDDSTNQEESYSKTDDSNMNKNNSSTAQSNTMTSSSGNSLITERYLYIQVVFHSLLIFVWILASLFLVLTYFVSGLNFISITSFFLPRWNIVNGIP